MRNEPSTNLQQLHERLGGLDFDAMLSEDDQAGAAAAKPVVRAAISLKQIAGLQAGGAFSLEVGSYLIGQRVGSPVLEAGQPEDPRFGLTMDPSGQVVIHPLDGAVKLDGEPISSPHALLVGQVVDAGVGRFMLDSSTQIVRRRAEVAAEAAEQMPAASEGRGPAENIVRWARETRDASAARRRAEMFGPASLSNRPLRGTEGLLVNGPESSRFGKVAVAIGDLPYALPGDQSVLNEATQMSLAQLAVLPSVPLDVDLLAASLAIVGDRSFTRPIASWIALGLAAQSPVEALGVALHARGNSDQWPWIESLPHTSGEAAVHLVVTIIDEDAAPPEVPEQGTVVLINDDQAAPVGCDLVLEVNSQGASLTNTAEGWSAREITPTGVSSIFALDAVFELRGALGMSGATR